MSEQTRARILAAARTLLTAPDGVAAFSIDAVAGEADVARMTVYYQFGSRAGLLEALFDDLAAHGGMEHLATAFQQPQARAALDAFISVFCRFWASDRLALRRLRGLAILDPELEEALRTRNERRRTGLTVLVQRLIDQEGQPPPGATEAVLATLHMLTSFETYDALAGSIHSQDEVMAIIQRLARAALDRGGV